MADFALSLWESVFTPGATPSLILATNASFGALQAILFALLLATHSPHFVILSILCGSLWWSINWFVDEVQASEELQRAKEKTPRPEDYKDTGKSGGVSGGEAEDEDGAATETEGEDMGSRASLLDPSSLPHKTDGDRPTSGQSEHLRPRPSSSAASESSGVQLGRSSSEGSDMRKRSSELEMSMTDSEWEKISEVGSTAPDTPDRTT